jgi:hypothetical protein
MPYDLLDIPGPLGNPQEREFEGWITNAIDQYFLLTKRRAHLFALSQQWEKVWPTDTAMYVDGKVIGLQFKRPSVSGAAPWGPCDLHWKFSRPAGQLALLMKFPEIYYCLPTFRNRRYRHGAIQHCVFWRPDEGLNETKKAWYYHSDHCRDDERAGLADAMRWGRFIERIFICEIGVTKTASELEEFLEEIRSRYRDLLRRRTRFRLHLLVIEDVVPTETGATQSERRPARSRRSRS